MRKKATLVTTVFAATLLAGSVQARGDLPEALSDRDFFADGNPGAEKVALGAALFWDKILSGNKNISCATCHHALAGTGDGLALPVGEGGAGLGIARDTGSGFDAIHERVPRNAPPLYNLGAREFTVMFHDGRIEADPEHPAGFRNPAGYALPPGLDNALAVQAMFPVTSAAEMAGQPGENGIADATAIGDLAGPEGVWEQLAERLRDEDNGYVDMFVDAYADIDDPGDITYVHAANAIAAYEAVAFRADNSPFDRYLRGKRKAMSKQAERGMKLFYGRAGCSDCHSGPFQTDLRYYAIAMPQIGPGKGDGPSLHDDYGREQVTGDFADRYRFRTPPLRNVALTGPWGHDGAYDTLRGVVEHHLDPEAGLADYDPAQLALPSRPDLDAIDLQIHYDDDTQEAIAAANELAPVRLKARQVDDLMAFLHALTDERSLDVRATVPRRVPSGLPLGD